MKSAMRFAALGSVMLSSLALAQSKPQVEVAPVVGVQFFRALTGPGLGLDQGLQNSAILGAEANALFGDRLRLGLGLEYTPTVAVGVDQFKHVLQPHLDASIDLMSGWIRPYAGVGVGVIGFIDNTWVGDSFAGKVSESASPDVEFSGSLMLGSRFFLGELSDALEGTSMRVDLRDVFYAPRNGTVNFMMAQPGALTHFHNLQMSLAFAWSFDAFGESDGGDSGAPEGADLLDLQAH